MKLTFWPKDSIYKIYKLLKKIPRGKQVDIFLETHELLQDTWRTATLVQYIRELEITVSITTKDHLIFENFSSHGVHTTYVGTLPWYSTLLQSITKYMGKSNPIMSPVEYLKTKLSLIAELLVLCLIVYLFRGTISPKATIHLTPTTTIQPISYGFLVYPYQNKPEITTNPLAVAWYTGSVQTSLSKTSDLQSFSTQLIPSSGIVRFYNTTTEEISLLAWTSLQTEEGVSFTLDTRVRLPAGSEEKPWTIDAKITANAYFEDGAPIGEQWNISATTKLYISKLPQSKEEKAVRAQPNKAFTNGQTILSGTVVSTDIQYLEKQLLEEINQQLPGIIRAKLENTDHLPLLLPNETKVVVNRFVTNAQPWQSASFIQWTIDVTIFYPYINKQELKKQSMIYIEQRMTSQNNEKWLSLERIDFYEPREIATWSYIVPTSIQTFSSYDFAEDPYEIIPQLKQAIAWKTKVDAINAALLFDEIHNIDITISPFWYNAVPKSVHNISVKTQDE